jgi:hypothetical protein
MALRKRPKPEETDQWIQAANVEDDQLSEESEKEIQSVRVRIPVDLLEEIDQLVGKRQPKTSRHNWILEALYEKVKREKKRESL